MTISNSRPGLSQKFNLFHPSSFVRVSNVDKCSRAIITRFSTLNPTGNSAHTKGNELRKEIFNSKLFRFPLDDLYLGQKIRSWG